MKILTILGARSQFIKAGLVSREIAKHREIEEVFLKENPDWFMVYGDTNSTLAGVIVASKLHIKLVHIEAGLRSFNMQMPEEVNRILTDRVSNVLFCPTDTAIENLKNIFEALEEIAKEKQIILPLHPRTKKIIENLQLNIQGLTIIEPVGYLEMGWLIDYSDLVMTDSGGLQKEACFFEKQCTTLRDETECVELVKCGANSLVGADKNEIVEAFNNHSTFNKENSKLDLYGGGMACGRIIEELRK